MAPRIFWKGYLKLSLVTCRVAMSPAVSDSEKVRFHTLNRATGHRVESRYLDSGTGKVVEEDDQVKGYQTGDDEYVMIEDEELESVALDSTRTIDIETFVPEDSIAWVWYDRAHYLLPDDEVGEEAFAVIRDAMVATGKVGISRLVMYRRERAVMIMPRKRGMILWTLRYGSEVRDADDYFGGLPASKVEPKVLKLAQTMIKERSQPWDPSMAGDPVQERLLEIIAAKKKGKRTAKPRPAAEPPSNVINIMDALRRSIASDERAKRR